MALENSAFWQGKMDSYIETGPVLVTMQPKMSEMHSKMSSLATCDDAAVSACMECLSAMPNVRQALDASHWEELDACILKKCIHVADTVIKAGVASKEASKGLQELVGELAVQYPLNAEITSLQNSLGEMLQKSSWKITVQAIEEAAGALVAVCTEESSSKEQKQEAFVALHNSKGAIDLTSPLPASCQQILQDGIAHVMSDLCAMSMDDDQWDQAFVNAGMACIECMKPLLAPESQSAITIHQRLMNVMSFEPEEELMEGIYVEKPSDHALSIFKNYHDAIQDLKRLFDQASENKNALTDLTLAQSDIRALFEHMTKFWSVFHAFLLHCQSLASEALTDAQTKFSVRAGGAAGGAVWHELRECSDLSELHDLASAEGSLYSVDPDDLAAFDRQLQEASCQTKKTFKNIKHITTKNCFV